MSDESIMKPVDGLAYEKWKDSGRIRLSTVLIAGFFGIFTSGWLLWYIFHRAGKPGRYVIIPLIACTGLAYVNWIFFLVGLAIYFTSWIYIFTVVKNYHTMYRRESMISPAAK